MFNNEDPVQIVGANFTENYAVTWERESGGATTFLRLDSNDSIGCNWVLDAANDINDDGWIVGVGSNPENQVRAFLLIPIPECFGDINYDGVVNVTDLVEVILQFGNCQDGKLCADTNGDCTVSSIDLAEVQLSWGCSESSSATGSPPPLVQAVVAIFLADPATFGPICVDLLCQGEVQ